MQGKTSKKVEMKEREGKRDDRKEGTVKGKRSKLRIREKKKNKAKREVSANEMRREQEGRKSAKWKRTGKKEKPQ